VALVKLASEIFRHSLLSRRSSALIRVISWLCIFGVGMGVASLVVVLSVMNGFDDAIRRRLISVQPHLIIHSSESQYDAVARIIQAREGTSALVTPFESQDVIVRTVEGYFSGAQARGISQKSLENMLIQNRKLRNAEAVSYFKVPETAEVDLKPNEVIVGIDLARGLEIFEGDEIIAVPPESLLLPSGVLPEYEKVRVKAIVRTNVPEVDSGMVLYEFGRSMKRLRRNSGRESGVEVQLKDPYAFQSLKEDLKKAGFSVDSWEERNKALFYSLKMEKIAMGLFLGLSVLIASFSILTVLVLMVTHKRSEIGVLMAMGLAAKKARRLLTGVGLVLSSFGVLGGVIVGLALCWMIDTFPILKLPDIYYDTRIPVLVDPVVVISLLICSGAIAFLSSWLPARYITRSPPSILLRPNRE